MPLKNWCATTKTKKSLRPNKKYRAYDNWDNCTSRTNVRIGKNIRRRNHNETDWSTKEIEKRVTDG